MCYDMDTASCAENKFAPPVLLKREYACGGSPLGSCIQIVVVLHKEGKNVLAVHTNLYADFKSCIYKSELLCYHEEKSE